MKPCNNLIVKSIAGNFTSVLEVGKRYVQILLNESGKLPDFDGRWKWEPDRVIHEPLRVFNDADQPIYECSTMKVFGDEKANYDEAKRFCFFGEQSLIENNNGGKCTAYSIGSNNKWNFEEDFFRSTKCNIETFDCTCNVTIPAEIKSRTRFWPTCLGTSDSNDKKFLTFKALNEMIGRKEGPDYLKVDIEGSVLILPQHTHQSY
jgi:hypothetical protein